MGFERIIWVCSLCNHEWQPRINSKPQTCPKCKRYDWDDEITDDKTGEEGDDGS